MGGSYNVGKCNYLWNLWALMNITKDSQASWPAFFQGQESITVHIYSLEGHSVRLIFYNLMVSTACNVPQGLQIFPVHSDMQFANLILFSRSLSYLKKYKPWYICCKKDGIYISFLKTNCDSMNSSSWKAINITA